MREEGEASCTESLGPALGTERCQEQVAMTAGCEEGAMLRSRLSRQWSCSHGVYCAYRLNFHKSRGRGYYCYPHFADMGIQYLAQGTYLVRASISPRSEARAAGNCLRLPLVDTGPEMSSSCCLGVGSPCPRRLLWGLSLYLGLWVPQ